MSTRVRVLWLVAAGVFVVAVASGVWGRSHTANRARLALAANAVPRGVAAPDVTLYPRDGEGVPLSAYRGRLVFVNFWATWCGPCRAEMPSLVALADAADPDTVAFVAIAEDDAWPPVDRYLKQNRLPFDVYRDQPPRVEELFKTSSYPTSFLIGADGQALYRFNGARDWGDPAVRELLELEGARFREVPP